ncbi:histidine phosphatase family protein [Leucothrix pacifica]|uniref:Histidine phosphatase family protein n=1 Tax=Leucothrix pacifica TaxID=1247513 RepID=A0A317C4K4_9GAMM|nr:histidine phosphatase family protein [Leucothrix pacifica]PWQ92293.1 histidine phosphatase family protein [Leucothrix pacifica]
MRIVYFISHPDVIVDADKPVPEWSLSERGLARMHDLLQQPWISDITAIYCSTEKKAIDGAEVLSKHCNLPIHQIHELGENDRSSTGFLPAKQFEAIADQFFAEPHNSVLGWETADAAQRRIVQAVTNITEQDKSSGAIVIVSHGAVGALLLCHLAGYEIARKHDQPGSGGGNYYAFDAATSQLIHGWKPIRS